MSRHRATPLGDLPYNPRRKRVMIVGGGIAGLAAAEALARTHPSLFEVSVQEAKRVTGGRAGSFTDSQTGEAVDYCRHVAMGCCTNLLALLGRVGLAEAWVPQRTLTFLHPQARPSRFRPTNWLPAPLHLLPPLRGLRFLDRRRRGEILFGLWRLMRSPDAGRTGLTAADWLRENRQSRVAIERFWDVILVSALGERTTRVSMAAARKVLIDGFAGAYGASDVFVPNRPLSEIFGRELPRAISDLGVRVDASSPVREIAWETGDAVQTRRDRIAGAARLSVMGREAESADHVISAVPWHTAAKLLGGLAEGAGLSVGRWAEIPASPISGIHLWFDRPITSKPHAVLVGTTAQWLFRDEGVSRESATPSSPSRETGHYYQVVISATERGGPPGRDRLVRQVVGELRQLFPQARQARLLRHRVVTDPLAVFSIRPEVETVRPPSRTKLPCLHLAGDWTATGWPATMEGAVISGRMAAASVCETEGLTPPTIDPGLPRGWLARHLIVPSPENGPGDR